MISLSPNNIHTNLFNSFHTQNPSNTFPHNPQIILLNLNPYSPSSIPNSYPINLTNSRNNTNFSQDIP